MVVKRKSYKKNHKGGKKSMRRMSKMRRRGGGMAPIDPAAFPTPLPEANAGLDAAFALAQDPLNRALMSGGKRKMTKKGRKGRKGKKSRGGNRLMENVRLLQNQAFIKGQTNPLFRALSHSGGSPAPIPPNTVQPADSNNWWVGENGQTFFAPTRQAAFNQSMALGNHPATKSMKQNRWVPFTR